MLEKDSKKIPQRTDIQCRYQYLKAKQSREVPWDPKEDDILVKKVTEMTNCSFVKLSSESASDISCDKGSPNNSLGVSIPPLPFYECNRHTHTTNYTSSESTKASVSTGWSASNLGFHRVIWLEVAEHMARMKLTNSLRTALECKTRLIELTRMTPSYSSAIQEEESYKCPNIKSDVASSLSSIPLSSTSSSTHINNNSRVAETTNNINISISNNSDNKNNNITITNNTFSHNITINITNTHNAITANPNSIFNTTNTHNNSHDNILQPSPLTLVMQEPNIKIFHMETAAPTHSSNLPIIQSDLKQTQNIVVMSFLSGLESLATAASTLPHERLLSDPLSPTCKAVVYTKSD